MPNIIFKCFYYFVQFASLIFSWFSGSWFHIRPCRNWYIGMNGTGIVNERHSWICVLLFVRPCGVLSGDYLFKAFSYGWLVVFVHGYFFSVVNVSRSPSTIVHSCNEYSETTERPFLNEYSIK